MAEFNMFKIRYEWYEGEFGETLLIKEVTNEQFEKDLVEAKDFAEGLKGKEIKDGSYLGRGYSVECLPEFYAQIIWFLTEKKRYAECRYDKSEKYYVDDAPAKKITIQRRVKRVDWKDIGLAK